MQVAKPLLRKRVLLFLATLPLLGVVAAFGIAPDTPLDLPEQATVVETLDLPNIEAMDSGSFDFWREERITHGDTLPTLLDRLGVGNEDARKLLQAARESKVLGRLTPGRTVLGRVSGAGQLLLFRYLLSDQTLITARRSGNDFQVTEEAVTLESRPILRSGEIISSLYGATDAADVPDNIASEMAEVFSGDIDFHKDLRKGDRFSLVYEAFYFQGQLVKTGRLLAAEFTNAGKRHQAVYFRDPQGKEGYFTPEGQNLKRAFLKSPLPYSRISSGFSQSRKHPILGYQRAHKGVDYAAPTGTPIRAVADAVVQFSGRKNGYGNLIVLRHKAPFSTAYGHLSRFAKGMKRGSRVSQGEVIGYVGATGLATGPHLHYEFRINNVQTNPLTLNLPHSYPLDTRYRSQFAAVAKPLSNQLDLLRGTNLAAFD
ncbi:MAG TPA: peptidoglycan DD-metalloendopeptidase family protein [Thiobacillaceae bacterium]|nr:peptidoglycan DD-metalloendopeptidase family protein [Thiobacillaceae bacterium]HNU64699.1 peptidoglycan DD-metalloendopeptidase family protein [Thiobacillaceae bacterium]